MCAPEPYHGCGCHWCEELRDGARRASVAFIEVDDVVLEYWGEWQD